MLRDLELAPSQVCGAFRLVPLLRQSARNDLRLGLSPESGFAATVPGAIYTSYIPHALILEWTDGSPIASVGTELNGNRSRSSVHGVFHRIAKRVDRRALRFLPLHLAMEGLLARHFGGPSIQWGDFSRQAISRGLSPRTETSYTGWALEGFEEALRVFEIHEDQVGVLVFVTDALATAFVTPCQEDYRKLHDTFLRDFFGELIWQYALLYPNPAPCEFSPAQTKFTTFTELRSAFQEVRNQWADFGRNAAAGLFEVPLSVEKVYKAGQFQLERFVSNLDPSTENYIGERVVAADGTLQYLKTYRLSATQTRRAYLLKQLAEHDWNIESIAKKYGLTAADILLQYERQGYGWLFQTHILDAARTNVKKRG